VWKWGESKPDESAGAERISSSKWGGRLAIVKIRYYPPGNFHRSNYRKSPGKGQKKMKAACLPNTPNCVCASEGGLLLIPGFYKCYSENLPFCVCGQSMKEKREKVR
jgi:hypothetical protein